ncbi:MAG: lipopolysaccharide heptosyltransferase II [Syntrophotaleaceae bacterium]
MPPAKTLTAPSWATARNILCIRLDSLGDVLMTTPALKALKAGRPERRITLLTSPAGARVATLIPEIQDVIIYSSPWMKATAPRADSRYEFEMVEVLRDRFDAVVIFTVFSQNPLPAAMLAYLANIPLRLAHCRENPYQLLTDWVRETDLDVNRGVRHEVRRQLDLVSAVNCRTEDETLSLSVSSGDRENLREKLADRRLDTTLPWLVIHPGASAPSRRYRPEGFASVVSTLQSVHGFQIVLTGSRDEIELVESIRRQAGVPALSLAGCLSLRELAALIAESPLLISNNTGPAHMAAALGTPVVDLYALTNPQHTPWQVPHRILNVDVPCRNCFKSICPHGHQDCLKKVSPEAIVTAALQLLADTPLELQCQEIGNR